MKAIIEMQNLQQIFLYNTIEVMTLKIKYPLIMLDHTHEAQTLINHQIMAQVNEFYQYVSCVLYDEAIKGYLYSKENDFPFNGYEAIMDYTITYKDHSFLSYYYDQYEYTGGAHGNTTRKSHTFELIRGTQIPLYCYFPMGTDYKLFLTDEIIRQASDRLKLNPGIYFDDYETLIVQNFQKENYFLTPEGLAIYYQHYDIAPYSTGIVVFVIPYSTLGWYPGK